MGEMIKKYFTGETKEINEEEKTDIGLVSTITIDRDGDVLLPEGCDLTNYKKNPVVQWAHEYRELPIGKALWVKTTDEGVLSKTKYANTEFANDVWELKKGGFLNAYSVGFMPLETITDEREIETIKTEKGINGDVRQIISKWELLEYSICPIPCNPDALTLMSKSVKSKEMKKMLKEIVKHEGDGDVKEDVPITKAGAVLNKKNKSDLKQAQELIQKVLDSAEAETEEPGKTIRDKEIATKQGLEGSDEEKRSKVRAAIEEKLNGGKPTNEKIDWYIFASFSDYVIIENYSEGAYYKISFAIIDNEVTLGEFIKGKLVFVPIKEQGQNSAEEAERKAQEELDKQAEIEAQKKAEAEKKAKEEADKAEEEKKAAELKAKEEADKKTAEILADIDKRIKSIKDRMNYVTGKVD